jgi:hypothetical protein
MATVELETVPLSLTNAHPVLPCEAAINTIAFVHTSGLMQQSSLPNVPVAPLTLDTD